mmetsp:Transcript_438/g.530  ORF Transcript_438/g.530 Transcript_438/m.530 type:complete len:195 (+) Transcript_438:227-811(+)
MCVSRDSLTIGMFIVTSTGVFKFGRFDSSCTFLLEHATIPLYSSHFQKKISVDILLSEEYLHPIKTAPQALSLLSSTVPKADFHIYSAPALYCVAGTYCSSYCLYCESKLILMQRKNHATSSTVPKATLLIWFERETLHIFKSEVCIIIPVIASCYVDDTIKHLRAQNHYTVLYSCCDVIEKVPTFKIQSPNFF